MATCSRQAPAAPGYGAEQTMPKQTLFATDRGGSWQSVLGQEEVREAAGEGHSTATTEPTQTLAEAEQGNSVWVPVLMNRTPSPHQTAPLGIGFSALSS